MQLFFFAGKSLHPNQPERLRAAEPYRHSHQFSEGSFRHRPVRWGPLDLLDHSDPSGPSDQLGLSDPRDRWDLSGPSDQLGLSDAWGRWGLWDAWGRCDVSGPSDQLGLSDPWHQWDLSGPSAQLTPLPGQRRMKLQPVLHRPES